MVNINTKRTIVADDYTELIIRYSTSKRYYVEARPDTKKRISNNLEMEFLDSIVGLSDEAIIMNLINHLFKDGIINKFTLDECVTDQIGCFDVFRATKQNKMLALQIAKSDLSIKIKETLRKRFYKARSEFLIENQKINFYDIEFSNTQACYFKTKEDKIYMELYMKNPSKYESEMEFLRKFIKEKIEYKDSVVEIYDYLIDYEEYNASVCTARYIKCDDLLIKISSQFESYITDIIEKHNKKVNKPKIKQLKLEGF